MAGVPYTFGSATTSIPLSQLDSNFTTPVTIGTTTVALGNTTTTLAGLTSVVTNTLTSAAATALTLQSAGTTALTIDTSQNVGIGTTSPGYKLDVQSSASSGAPLLANFQSAGGDTQVYVYNGTIRTQLTADATNSVSIVGSATNHPLVFRTNNAERARIDTSGSLLVGTTTSNGFLFKVQAATDVCLAVASGSGVTGAITLNAINNANSANVPFDIRASAIYGSTGIGTTASAANAYFNNASSNQFLRSTSALKYKTNIRDLESIDVNKFRPVRYNSLCEADDKTKEHFGIIADEVDAVGIKELVTYGEDNQIEGFQYERLTVVLLKAIQEQQALITALTARITALENK